MSWPAHAPYFLGPRNRCYDADDEEDQRGIIGSQRIIRPNENKISHRWRGRETKLI
jgi:hypothetical protein